MKKIRTPLKISVCIIIVAVLYYFMSHSIYWKYNDWWILGKCMPFDASKPDHEIEKRYGEFDVNLPETDAVGYYLYTDNSGDKYYYLIELNPKNRATDVYIGTLECEE